jgi:hypothetical protein
MVGSPKTLHDLRKVDADLQVICRTCSRRVYLDREWLIAELMRRKTKHGLGCSSAPVALLRR